LRISKIGTGWKARRTLLSTRPEKVMLNSSRDVAADDLGAVGKAELEQGGSGWRPAPCR
jgi:hypothetical protein